jgi:hypothetical protein
MAVLIHPNAARVHARRAIGERASWRRPASRLLFLAVTLAWCGFGAAPLQAQEFNRKEYQVKAVFLFNFIQFVEWPATSFPTAEAPIKIGVYGDDPFAGALEAAVHGEKVRQRSIVIERSSRLEALRECHVVFVCRSERESVGTILAVLGSRPVLTVGEVPDFARRGGVINFYLEGQKVRFEINRAAAQRSGLKLSSQLLSLARLVGPPLAIGTP